MLSPENKHRFEGDSGQDIANCHIDILFPDGNKKKVVLRLGAPFRKRDQWWIRTELENLDTTEGSIAGADSLRPLIMGIRWIILRLESFEQKLHCRCLWADDKEPFDYRSQLTAYEKKA